MYIPNRDDGRPKKLKCANPNAEWGEFVFRFNYGFLEGFRLAVWVYSLPLAMFSGV